MLILRRRRLETVADIHRALTGAARLELATIPVYLTALYSIKPGANEAIAAILHEVARQEMLHFCLVCNLLNATGGGSSIDVRGFAGTYPHALPMGIGTQPGQPFIVPLRRLSPELVRDVFMRIEEPEDPLSFAKAARPVKNLHTIGDFYDALERAIAAHGNALFTGDPRRQVTGWFSGSELFAVTDMKSASRAIRVIVEQGEGTKTRPTDVEGGLAHYYLFAQIAKGRMLVIDPRQPEGYAYHGEAVPFDAAGVYPMVENPALVKLPAGSLLARCADQFDLTYTNLLDALQMTFDGHPGHLGAAIGLMFALRLQAQQLMQTRIPGKNVNAGPRWRVVLSP